MGRFKFAKSEVVHINKDFISKLQKEYSIKYFVETGTYNGNTSLWASSIFKRVYTIEGYVSYYKRSVKKCSSKSNITLINGDSTKKLKKVLSELDNVAVCWLDAHHTGSASSYGKITHPTFRRNRINC